MSTRRKRAAPAGGWVGRFDLGANGLGEQAEELVLVADVPLDGGGADADAVGKIAHAKAVEPDLVEQFERGTHDVVDLKRIASTGASRARHVSPFSLTVFDESAQRPPV